MIVEMIANMLYRDSLSFIDFEDFFGKEKNEPIPY